MDFENKRPSLIKTARRMGLSIEDAEDVVQDTFYRALCTQGIRHFDSWLYRTFTNACINRSRDTRNAAKKRVPFYDSDCEDPDDFIERLARREAIRMALRGLTRQQRKVVQMRMQNATLPEIAAYLKLSLRHIGRTKDSAYEILRVKLSDFSL